MINWNYAGKIKIPGTNPMYKTSNATRTYLDKNPVNTAYVYITIAKDGIIMKYTNNLSPQTTTRLYRPTPSTYSTCIMHNILQNRGNKGNQVKYIPRYKTNLKKIFFNG